jgi:short-subunit dehydrogenase
MIRMGVGSQFVQIAGASVLLTGATGGIGGAIARALHARGASLTLSGRRAEVLDELSSELGARTLLADLSQPPQAAVLARQAGEIDILIANAGVPASGTLESLSAGEIDIALEVNLRAPIVLARALAPAMARRRRGHLVFMCSLAAKVATPGASLYSASKYGLRGFAASLRGELRDSGVGVSAVFPGFIHDTGMFPEHEVKLPPGAGPRSPQDVARAVVGAIEKDRGEVHVAPLPLRAGTAFAGLAPELAASVARRLGSDRITRSIVDAQRDSQ